MTWNMQDRLAHCDTRMKELNAETVTYTRSGIPYILTASPILREAEEMIPDIGVTRIERQEWCIDVADLPFGVPLRGDQITRGTGEVYDICSYGGNDPAYRYTTSSHRRYCINSVRSVA